MIRTFLLCFSLFVISATYAESTKKQDSHPLLDSIFKVLDKNPSEKSSYKILDEIINEQFYKNPDYALAIAMKQIRYARKADDFQALATAMLNSGIAYDFKGDYTLALSRYEEALKLAEKYKLTRLKGDIYNNFSITHAVIGNMEESISTALKALEIFETENDSARMSRIYNNLGSRYSEMGYSDKALEYYNKAAIINKNLNDTKKLAFNYGNIGLLHYENDEDEKALEFFQKSMELQDTINDKYNFSIALHNLALVYQSMKKYDKALNYEKRAYAMSNKINDELGKITSMNGIAAIHKDMGLKRKALEYFHQSGALAEKIGARYYLISIYESIAGLYAQLHDYQNAFIYNQKFNTLKDSIMSSEKDKAVQKIKEFENEKTQQEISLLTKDTEIQKLQIKRQKIIRNSVTGVGVLIFLLAIGLLHRYRYVRKTRNELSAKNIIINREKDRSDELLLNILPAETAEELMNNGRSEARHFDMVTVMFTDFKGFTFMAEQLTPQELVDEIDYCFKHFDEIISRHHIEKIKTIGDAYMCAGGLPVANDTNPLDVVKAALEIQEFMETLKKERKAQNKLFFEARIGIHSGPVVAGIVGIKKFQYDIWGDTVNIASRMESSGEIGQVNISQTTYNAVKDHFECAYRGEIAAKNKGAIDMYFVSGIKM